MWQFLQESARAAIQTGTELTWLQAVRSKEAVISDDTNVGHTGSNSVFKKKTTKWAI
jgi:hypothetical protein